MESSNCNSCNSPLAGEVMAIKTEARTINLCPPCVKKGYENLLKLKKRGKDETHLMMHFKKFLLRKKMLAES